MPPISLKRRHYRSWERYSDPLLTWVYQSGPTRDYQRGTGAAPAIRELAIRSSPLTAGVQAAQKLYDVGSMAFAFGSKPMHFGHGGAGIRMNTTNSQRERPGDVIRKKRPPRL